MIVGANIPFRAETFIRRCTEDVMQRRYALDPDGWLRYLEAETERRPRYKPLLHYIKVLDRTSGQPRYVADADHIVPRSVWGILMFGFLARGRCGASFNVLSNLFWRDREWNRNEDRFAIDTIQREARGQRLSSADGFDWRRHWIEHFLRTKRYEGVPFPGDLIDPGQLDEVIAAQEHSNWLNRG